MNELSLFTGGGGGLLGSQLLGWNTRCAVEIDPACRRMLFDRQRDGVLERFPIWDDVRTFDGSEWRGHIDVVSGGFPCQDISAAGRKQGISGARSSLVFDMLRVVDTVRPAFVFAENSPNLRTRGLGTIIKELAKMGYMGRYGVLGASDVGAAHRRKRMWVVAYSDSVRRLQQKGGITSLGKWPRDGVKGQVRPFVWHDIHQLQGVYDGMANRMDRIRATGNGQVPAVAALAWSLLTSDLGIYV